MRPRLRQTKIDKKIKDMINTNNIMLEVDEATRNMVDSLKSSISGDISGEILAMKSAMESQAASLADSVERLDRKIFPKRELEDSLEGVAASLEDIGADLGRLLQDIGKIESIPDFKPLIDAIISANESVADLDGRIERLGREQAEASEAQAKRAADLIGLLSERHDRADQSIARIDEAISFLARSIEEEKRERENWQKSIDERLAGIYGAISSLGAKASEDAASIGAKIDGAAAALGAKADEAAAIVANKVNESSVALGQKADEAMAANKEMHASAMSRLYKILITVTPFWRKKKIENEE